MRGSAADRKRRGGGAGILILSLLLAGIVAGRGRASLPSSTWMPGYPIVAGNQLALMWAPVPGAVRYRVLMNGNPVAETSGFQHSMRLPEESGEYAFAVVAIDAMGGESLPSREWATKVVKLSPPAAMYSRLMESGALSIRWEPVPGAVLYNLYRREGARGDYRLAASVQDISWTDAAPGKETETFYAVSAKDASGKESGLSAPVKVAAARRAIVKGKPFQELIPITTALVKRIRTIQSGRKRIPIRNPGGVVLYRGNLYWTDILSGKVYVVDEWTHNCVGVFGGPDEEEGAVRRAIGIEADDKGNLYVADAFEGKIVKFSSDGKYLDTFHLPPATLDRLGLEETRTAGPFDLRMLKDGGIAVVDNGGNRIVFLGGDGKVRGELRQATDGRTTVQFSRPTAIDIDPETGDMYIADALHNRIVVVDRDWKLLRTIGEPGDVVGMFSGLLGLALDKKRGWVVAGDSRLSNLQIFDMKTGKYLYSVAGERPVAPMEISKPQKIRLLPDGSFIATEGLIDESGGGIVIFRILDGPAPRK